MTAYQQALSLVIPSTRTLVLRNLVPRHGGVSPFCSVEEEFSYARLRLVCPLGNRGNIAARSNALRLFPDAGFRYLISPGGPYLPKVFFRFLEFFAIFISSAGASYDADPRRFRTILLSTRC